MLVADFAIVIAVAIVQTCLAHAALHGDRERQHPPAGLRWQFGSADGVFCWCSSSPFRLTMGEATETGALDGGHPAAGGR